MITRAAVAHSHRIRDGAIAALNRHGYTPRLIAWALALDLTTVGRHIATDLPQLPERNPAPRTIPLTLEQESIVIAFYLQSSPLPGMQRWTLRTAAKQINADLTLLGRTVHHSTIARVLARNFLRPHKHAYFLHIRDPLFFEKMYHILWVYSRNLKNLFCFDECPNIQAISRSGPDVPEDNGTTSRETVYRRNGTTDLFGFLHVPTGEIAAYCRPSHETETLTGVFTDHVRSQPAHEPLHYICDNLYPHFNAEFCKAVADLCQVPHPSTEDLSSGEKRRQWLQREDKRIVIHFLPFHGSWLNQAEVWFGMVRRYTLNDGWFESVEALIAAILAFAETWNEYMAHPFNFQYDGKGLENAVLRRFTKILSKKLEQVDSKFLADLSLLCVRLIDHHREKIREGEWNVLAETVRCWKPDLDDIIAAEPGPIRQRRAREAFQKLWDHVQLPESPAELPATHH